MSEDTVYAEDSAAEGSAVGDTATKGIGIEDSPKKILC
jgi:hypothetical protein